MKRYEVYRETESPFLEIVPEHWLDTRIRHAYTIKSIDNNQNEPLLSVFLNRGVVSYTDTDMKQVHKPSEDMSTYQLVEPGDFVLNNQQAWRGSVGVSSYRGIVSPAYIVMHPIMDNNSRFMNYMLRETACISQFVLASKGVGSIQRILSPVKLNSSIIVLPPRAEQDQIVRYLDWQVSKINRLIAAKRKQIDILLEQHKHIINDAVFHGIAENVSLCDSGIEWIGAIPTHWDTVRCKYIFKERDERSVAGEEEHLSMSQKYGLIPDSKLDERRMLSESYVGGKICYKDDLVLNRLKAHLGVFALSPQKGVVSPDYTVLVPNMEYIEPAYGEAVLKSDMCRRELRIRVRGIIEGFWRLYTDDFNTIVMPLPPLKEQKQIMEYLDTLRKSFVGLQRKLESEISTLKDLRTRLISDVVTGQVDVRGIEVPEYDSVEDVGEEQIELQEEMEEVICRF